MANTGQPLHSSPSNADGASSRAHAASTQIDDLAAKGAAAFREAQTSVECAIADASERGHQALTFAGQKGQEAMDGVREVGDTLAVAIEKSVKTRPYTTLALVMAAGFLIGATWRR